MVLLKKLKKYWRSDIVPVHRITLISTFWASGDQLKKLIKKIKREYVNVLPWSVPFTSELKIVGVSQDKSVNTSKYIQSLCQNYYINVCLELSSGQLRL